MKKFNQVILKIKQNLNDYFAFEKSLGELMKVLRKYYIFSIDFDEMHYGLKK